MKKHIANGFTLLNLFFGCLAIVAALQQGLTVSVSETGDQTAIGLPEKMVMASIFIGIAALVDFLDGFVARLLKINSELGKQLDSLADVVSFGVAPAMILFQFLRISFAQEVGGLDVNGIWFLPAFLLPMAGAYRLGRFNLDNSGGTVFKGVPIPAAGLVVATFPLIYWFANPAFLSVILNKWFLYAVILILCYLMISSIPMLSLKFKHFSPKKDWAIIVLAIIAIVGALTLGWLTILVVFVFYILFSLITLRRKLD